MNVAVKNEIISELENLPEQKVNSVLDYIHFLAHEASGHYPNQTTREAIEQLNRDKDSLKSYSSAEEMFQDMGIEI